MRSLFSKSRLLTRALASLALACVPAIALAQSPQTPQVTIQPRGHTVLGTLSLSVTIDWCLPWGSASSFDPNTRAIKLNGTNVTGQFTHSDYGWWDFPDCEFYERSSGTITLQPGAANSFTAEIATYVYYWWGYDAVTYHTPSAAEAEGSVLVIAASQYATAPSSTSNRTATFTVRHTGYVDGSGDGQKTPPPGPDDPTTTYSIAVACSGAGISSSCTRSATSVTLSPGQQTDVTVTYSTTAEVGSTGMIRLTASGGGASDSTWTEVTVSPLPRAGVQIVTPGDQIPRSACVTLAGGPMAAVECGDLRVVHPLPGVLTLGTDRAPTLIYNSQHASPRPLVAANVTLTTARPATVEAIIRNASGVQIGAASWPGSQWGASNTAERRRIVVPVDVPLATGLHPYTLEVRYVWSTGSPTVTMVSGQLPVVNRSDSEYGAGWWLAGREQIVVLDSLRLFWIAGDGSAKLYSRPAGSGQIYRAPRVTRPDSITRNAAGQYTRHAPLLLKVHFSGAGQHDSTTNRLGKTTRFVYDGNARLQYLRVPTLGTPLSYEFHYYNGKLSKVVAPRATPSVAREVNIAMNGGRLVSIQGPDTTSVVFEYESGGTPNRLNKRVDRRGYSTQYKYDAAGRVQWHWRKDGTDSVGVQIRVAETRGLPAAFGGSASPLDSVYTLHDGPRSDVLDVTKFWVNHLGAPTRVRDALGRETRLTYDAVWPGLVKESVAPNRLVSRVSYNGRGLVESSTVEAPFGGVHATTTYVWHATLELPTSIKSPLQIESKFEYDAATGNRLWQQTGGISRRVTFGYDGNGLLRAMTQPASLNIPAESLYYDGNGNVNKTRSSLGLVRFAHRDGIGRDTLTTFEGTWTRNIYDVMDRVIQTTSFGPSVAISAQGAQSNTAPADSLWVDTRYDKEGNVERVTRYFRYQGTLEGLLTAWTYDAFGRQKTYESIGAGTETYTYDRAGNVTALLKGGRTVTTQYDPLNRPTQRITPSVNYESVSCAVVLNTWACTFDFPAVCIRADTARFAYTESGQLQRADNAYARVRRSYYPNGALRADTLRTRRYYSSAANPCEFADPAGTGGGVEGDFASHIYGLQYYYNLDGQRDSLKLPSQFGSAHRYAYHTATGELLSVTDHQGYLTSYQYDDAGRLSQTTYPGGRSESYAYDHDSRLRWQGGLRPEQWITRDSHGRITRVSPLEHGGYADPRMWYNGLGAVVAIENFTGGASLEEFKVDALGNRRWSRHRGLKDPNHYDYDGERVWTNINGQLERQHWRMPKCTPGPEEPCNVYYEFDQGYSYDGAGNTAFALTYEYDHTTESLRQVSVRHYYGADQKLRFRYQHQGRGAWADGGPAAPAPFDEYRYDALGRRILVMSKRPPSCGTNCPHYIERTVWDGDQVLMDIRGPAPHNASGGILETDSPVNTWPVTHFYGRVIYAHAGGIDQPVTIHTPHGTVAPIANWRGDYVDGIHLGHTTYPAPLDSECCPNAGWPWPGGNVSLDGASQPGDTHPRWFGNLITDKTDASGLRYMRNRYYDPASGQFTQQDPIGLAGGLNLYGFADGDPVNFSDPFGLSACCPAPVHIGPQLMGEVQNTFREQVRQAEWQVAQALSDAVFAVGIAKVIGGVLGTAGRGSTGANQAANSADFVVTARGTAVPVSQSRMQAGFNAAGFPNKPTTAPGTEYTLPNGSTVRAMAPSANASRRASFEANGHPVTPDGTVPQPPRGMTRSQRAEYVRERTHVIQRP